jgi:hypothetical protein
VRQLAAAGLTRSQIAARLAASYWAVRADLDRWAA